NNIVLSFSLKSEHEQSKELKSYQAKSTQLKKDLGEVEAKINTLEIEGFRARNNASELSAIEAQVSAQEATKTAIRDEIEQTATLVSKLAEINVEKQVIKLLKRYRKFSVKAVEDLLKSTTE
ncbi:TPA: hypothetical protein VEN67_006655, partial [Pseudomonas aeruginosa]|nr:hypothetical protein [Pseudomonas aeruginosa]